MSELRIGTCSWKYDSWRGLVYSEQSDINYLEEYSRQYDTVEIDQWFWSLFNSAKPKLPLPGIVKEYSESVPPDFKFSIKVPNSITLTHYYRKDRSQPLQPNPHFFSPRLFDEFQSLLEPMADQIGVLLFQFEYLNRQKMPSQSEFLGQFREFAERCSRRYPLGIEIRNPNYINERLFDFLARNRMYFVFMQGYYMPSIVGLYHQYKEYLEDLTVIRLMGPDRKEIERKSGKKWAAIVENRDGELAEIAAMVRDLTDRGINIYMNVNNHYEGSAPLTIHKLRRLLA